MKDSGLEGDMKRWIQDWSYAGLEGYRKRGFKTGVMLGKRDTVLLGCRTGGMPGPERCSIGQEECRTGGMQDRRDAGQV